MLLGSIRAVTLHGVSGIHWISKKRFLGSVVDVSMAGCSVMDGELRGDCGMAGGGQVTSLTDFDNYVSYCIIFITQFVFPSTRSLECKYGIVMTVCVVRMITDIYF